MGVTWTSNLKIKKINILKVKHYLTPEEYYTIIIFQILSIIQHMYPKCAQVLMFDS